MEQKILDSITVYDLKDLPCKLEYGFSIYKGVLIAWPEGYPNKNRELSVIRFIDFLPGDVRELLAVVHIAFEQEVVCGKDNFMDVFHFIWKYSQLVPPMFFRGNIISHEKSNVCGMVCTSKGPNGDLVAEKVENFDLEDLNTSF